MATKRRIPLNRVEAVGAGSTAVIQLPRNVRYHSIGLIYGTDTAGGANKANMEAQITQVRVKINEVTQRTFSAAELFKINQSKGKIFATGTLPIFFSEPQRNTQMERELTAWGMMNVGDFQIEVDIKDAGQTPTLSGFAVVDDVQEEPKGIVKWKRNKIVNASTGELQYRLLTDGGDSYQGLYCFEETAGSIENLMIEWDGIKIHDLSDAEQDAFMDYFTNNATRVDGVWQVPFDGNMPADALRTVKMVNGNAKPVQELLATFTMGLAEDVTVIREMLGVPD